METFALMAQKKKKRCEGHCPKCGSHDIRRYFDDIPLAVYSRCNRCDCSFTEYYEPIYLHTVWNDEKEEKSSL